MSSAPPKSPAAGKLSSIADVNAATTAMCRDSMQELGDMLGSLGVSISEAGFRGSSGLCRLHLIQAKGVLKTAIDALKDWEASLPRETAK